MPCNWLGPQEGLVLTGKAQMILVVMHYMDDGVSYVLSRKNRRL